VGKIEESRHEKPNKLWGNYIGDNEGKHSEGGKGIYNIIFLGLNGNSEPFG
jgi:hypothetical protein